MHLFSIIIKHTANSQVLMPSSISGFVFHIYSDYIYNHSIIKLDS